MHQLRLLLLAAVLLFGTASTSTGQTAYTDPPMVASHAGNLTIDLTAAPGSHTIQGHSYPGMFYNGAYVPPVWRVQPGDTLVVHLQNRLSEVTNLHFHGMGVSPLGNGDNVFLHVQPGHDFTYKIRIPQQHVGLFWFHPHAHGFVDKQIIGGLSGGIIVEGSQRFYPFLQGLTEHVMLLKHIPGATPDYDELVTINGLAAPTISIRPGEMQFWRVANIGADLFLKLRIEGMPFYVLATDGYWLSRPEKMDEMLIGPGQRREVVVVGQRPGRYTLKSVPFVLEEGRPPLPERALATVVSQGPAANPAEAEAKVLAQKVTERRLIELLRSSPVARRRTMTFSRSPDKTKFFINGKLFDENRTDVTVKLGETEEWTILNTDDQLHNFHIHQTGFLVTEVNGVPRHFDSLRDTFTLPPATNGKPGEVKVLIPFTDPTIVGRFVFHCHVVKHEDKGMMQTIEVTK
jgi:FtsP/CotA-like multicopper oxidase with cupredoxin domain